MLYINHSGKFIEINVNMKIPFSILFGILCSRQLARRRSFGRRC